MSKKIEEKPVTEFEVDSSGTLTMTGFAELELRSEFYGSVAQSWTKSTAHLADAMEECPPLSWAVHNIYTEVREEIQSDLEQVSRSWSAFERRTAALKARLKQMPEEPEDGAEAWLLTLTSSEFANRVVPVIQEWFDSPPDWNWEDDYLPKDATSQGAALEFFQSMSEDDLDAIGVTIVEGDHPGSTYYAAELTMDVDEANTAAEKAGIPVRFKVGN